MPGPPGRDGRCVGICDGFGRGGIDAGFGRGMPLGPEPERGGTPAPGREPPGGVNPNGLLPAPRDGGRAPGRPTPGPGVTPGPGRGVVGVGAGFGAGGSTDGPPRFAASAAFTAASCSAFNAVARASAAATSMSCALAGFNGGGAGTGALRAAAFAGGAGLAVAFGALFGALGAAGVGAETIASRSRRATGASTVLDADFTYSPISCSFASTVLLSTPSSFASSCTRALPATALLTCEAVRAGPQRPQSSTRSLVISGASSCAHVGRPTLLSGARRRSLRHRSCAVRRYVLPWCIVRSFR